MNKKPEFPRISEPCKIGQMSLTNHLVLPSMGNNYGTEDGHVTERQINYYKERAQNGPGLIITEMVSIDSPMGRRGSHQLRIDDDSFIEGLGRLAHQIHGCNRKIALQLCHAGIEAGTRSFGLLPLSPSPIDNFKGLKGREVTENEIEYIVNQFVKGALRAKAANFDGIEVHAAHNYLLAHFLSPIWNKRKDKYGGNTKNRARILVEIISRIRKVVGPDYPVWCRMNGFEFGIEGGLSIDEAKEIARMAEQAGCDALHVSAAGYGPYSGYSRACMGNPRGNLAELAAEIKKAVNIPVIAVGRIDLKLGEELVRESKADCIAIGRGHIADPNLIKKAFEGNFDDIRPCIGCNTCVDDLTALDVTLHCSVNACVGQECESKIIPAQKVKRVLVVGGGPGGMETAIVAAQRGHDVTLFEKQPQLGGKLNLAAKPPHKDEISLFTNYLIYQMKKLDIRIELEKAIDAAFVKKFNPDVVIVATGSNPLIPKIKGIDCCNVVFAEDVLSGKEVGQKVVVIGGGLVGCETADFLVEKGKVVTIVELLDEIATGIGASLRIALLHRLNTNNVTMVAGVKCQQISERGVVIINQEQREETIASDSVVLAVGAKANVELLKSIQGAIPEIYAVGDCVEPRRIINAVSDGHRIGLFI